MKEQRLNQNRRGRWKNRLLSGALAVLLASSCLWASGCTSEPGGDVVNPTVAVAEGVALPRFDQEVLLCSDEAKQVYDRTMKIENAVATGAPYRPFVFEYQLEQSGTLRLGLDSALADAREYPLDKANSSVIIDNLQTGSTYHYQVEVAGNTYSGSFRTAVSNRYISIPGVENLRDIGGYQTLDGKTVKQGLLIRGCELDGIKNEDYLLADEAVDSAKKTFGFVYDLDLRSPEIFEGEYVSPLGADVAHRFYDAPTYAQIFREEYLESMKQIFSDLADPEKYPMYLHCTWGRDRTGTVVLLLQGLLNVSKEDLLREYRLTAYVNAPVATNTKMDALFLGLDSYEGDTLQEKIISYLTTTVGVTREQIQSIQSIFLD